MSWSSGAAVLGAVAISHCFALLAIKIAPPLGLVDRPDGERKRHPNATPLMGGVAIYLSLLTSAVCVSFLNDWWSPGGTRERFNFAMLLVSGGLFCGLGLLDDRWHLRARSKFVLQMAASLPFAIWGRSIDAIDFLGLHVQLGLWGTLFTVLWLVAFSNVINLIDGMDGLAGTVGLIVLLTLASLASICGDPDIAVFSLLVAGSLGGFLIHNWPPAKLFMGDSGSLSVGFLIGALSIESWLKQAAGFTLIVPLVLVSIPMFDTMMAIIRRKLTGRSVGQADRAHIHHRLQDRGFTPLQVLLTLAGLCLAMAVVAIASVFFDSDLLAVGLCTSILALLIVGRVFGHHEVLLFSRQLRDLRELIVDAAGLVWFRHGVLQTVDPVVHQLPPSWTTICRRVQEAGGVSLEFVCRDTADRLLGETLRWESPERFGPSDDAWTVRLSARRDAGRRVTLCVAGEAEFRVEALRTGDLLELLAGFCETFPLDDGVLHAESDRSSDGPPDVAIAGVIGPRTSGLETTRRAA